MNKIAIYLNQHIVGNIYDKSSILEAYSFDRSILKVMPKFVAMPENSQDISRILRFSNQYAEKNYRLPISVRGSGLDKVGADLTNGIVISTERMNKIVEIDEREKLVHVQAGITLGELNAALALRGLTLPVNSNPKETIGGLIANCATDSYASKYGGIMNFIDRAEVVLASGDIIQTARLSEKALARKKELRTLEGKIYREIDNLINKNTESIDKIRTNGNSYGYPAVSYIKRNHGRTFDILPIFYASEGTLGVVSEVILRCEVLPPAPTHLFVSFNTFRAAHDFLKSVSALNPLEANFYDIRIFKKIEDCGKKLEILKHKNTDGYIVLVSFNDSRRKAKKKISKCLAELGKSVYYVAEDENNKNEIANFLSGLSSFINDDARGEYAPILDDFYVPNDKLRDFLSETKYPVFGSFITNNYNIRLDLKINTVEGRQKALQILKDFDETLSSYGGSLTGGYPEGALKAMFTNRSIPPEQKEIYTAIKQVFDPNNILNPYSKLSADTRTTISRLRASLRGGISEIL